MAMAMVGLRVILLAAVALGLGACATGEPGSKDRRLFGLKVKPAPYETRPGEEKQRKRAGLISGEDGGITVYREPARGSADPTKPEKAKR